MSLARYYHTLRHLRPVQFYGRAVHRFHRPRPDTRPAPPLRMDPQPFPLPPTRAPSLLGPATLRLINVTRELATPAAWNDPAVDKLWLYNLHYFDDLNAEGRDVRAEWQRHLIERWIAENPPGSGNGWEPYPLSLRIVNWVKWSLAGHALPAGAVESLAVQARFLCKRLEYHLLGNHLWTNGKALVVAGAFFAGDEARRWLDTGLDIARTQLAEQILADGGHFERSPMYHSIIVEDLLDLVALTDCYPTLVERHDVDRWRATLALMLRWLQTMTHPDGDIPLFNDAAWGVAPRPDVLRSLAGAIGVEPALTPAAAPATQLVRLDASGYLRMTAGDFVVIADVGPVGPDYIPGHAHADTLSFELSWRGQRVLSNSGTSTYVAGSQRERERATAAHSTVAIDDADSSEVWHVFRVARRARPFGLEAADRSGRVIAACSHDGYTRLPGRPTHRREWQLGPDGLEVRDEITGGGEHRATGYLHVHPGIDVTRTGERSFDLTVPAAGRLSLHVEDSAGAELQEGCFAPGFNRLIARPIIAWHRSGPLPLAAGVTLRPAD